VDWRPSIPPSEFVERDPVQKQLSRERFIPDRKQFRPLLMIQQIKSRRITVVYRKNQPGRAIPIQFAEVQLSAAGGTRRPASEGA
jgi:hypothetical protein